MKRRNLFLLIVVFCMTISTIMCSKSSYNSGNPPPPTGTTATVNISGMAFVPASLTVKTGTTIVWKNSDGVTHAPIADDGSSFSTGNILAGYSGSATVSKTGTFPYHCSIHSNMTGTIIVTP